MARKVNVNLLNDLLKEQEQKDLTDLRAEVRRLAKQANQRMVRIERWESEQSSYAYDNAQDYLQSLGRTRFKESPKQLTEAELNREKRYLEKFLNAQTSTKTGTLKVIRTKQEATTKYVKEKFGKEITKKDYDKLINIFKNKKTYSKVNKYIDSKRIIEKFINAKPEEKDEIIKLFETIETEGTMTFKTKEEADYLNNFFDRKIFNYENISIDKDETEDIMF